MRICENKNRSTIQASKGGRGRGKACQVRLLGSKIQTSLPDPHPLEDLYPQNNRKGYRSTRSIVVLVTQCMYYSRPSGQTLNLRVKEHKKALTSGDTSMPAIAEHTMHSNPQQ